LDSAVIGIENVIWLPTLERLKQAFPKMRFKEATSLFHRARQVKTPDEIAALRKAVAIMQSALDVTFQSLTEGMTEREAAGIAQKEVIAQGADPIFMVIEFGANGAHVDTWPTETPLKKGDLVHTDCVCLYEHYYADTARSVVFGQEPTAKQRQYFEAVVQAEQRGVECIKPGARASEVFRIMDATLRQGIPHATRFNVGHSIGLEVWEPPLLAPGDDTVLEQDMVINIEPPYSEFGFGGLQVEDTLLITADGNEMLTRLDESLKI
jgi:Xaa-Pro aminopeptidase